MRTLKYSIFFIILFLFINVNFVFAGAGIRLDRNLWNQGTVWYEFEDDFGPAVAGRIIRVINSINVLLEVEAGVTLAECSGWGTPSSNCDQPPLRLTSTTIPGHCASTVGFNHPLTLGGVTRNQNKMLLHTSCDEVAIMHEFGHAIGLFHEHQRSDRDYYVLVITDNVEDDPFTRKEFEKLQSNHLRLLGPYDYRSLMHYHQCAFLQPELDCGGLRRTIFKPFGEPAIGFARSFSRNDIKSIKGLYKDKSQPPELGNDVYRVPGRSTTVTIEQEKFNGFDELLPTEKGLSFNDGDFNGDMREIRITRRPQGTVNLTDNEKGNFTFTFKPGDRRDSFLYSRASRGGGGSSNAYVRIDKGSSPSKGLRASMPSRGTITSSPEGINCGENGDVCEFDFETNTFVSLSASPSTGYRFGVWTGNCSGNKKTTKVFMDNPKHCEAQFELGEELPEEEEAIPPPPTTIVSLNKLSISVIGNGFVTSSPSGISCPPVRNCTDTFSPDSTVVLNIIQTTGYSFSGWSGDCSGNSRKLSVVMDSSKSCTATFVESTTQPLPEPVSNTRTLTIRKNGTGLVASIPPGINCGDVCKSDFRLNSRVNLRAIPLGDYRFSNWAGDCSGGTLTGSSISFTMDADKICTANFTRISTPTPTPPRPVTMHVLRVTKTGSGTVTSSPTGINCGSDCIQRYRLNTRVTLRAQPAGGYRFSSWSGACSGSALTGTSASVTMNSSKTCTANFTRISTPTPPPRPVTKRTLRVTKIGSGTVTSSPSGINCGSDCSHQYNLNSRVTLRARAASGYRFSSWSGACSGSALTGTSASVTMSSNKTCTANFTRLRTTTPNPPRPVTTRTLRVTKSGIGTITSSPSGINCGSDCSHSFRLNSRVSLRARPGRGYQFRNWSGACSGSILTGASTSVTMSSNKTCGATFIRSGFLRQTVEEEKQEEQ